MATFLEQWNDPGLPTEDQFDWEAYATEQVNRLVRLCLIAARASEHKHRLGQDASRAELAADKKLSKRLKSAFWQYAEQWGAHMPDEVDEYATKHAEELSRLGAQVDWATEVDNHRAYMQRQLALVATTCIRNGDIKTGNKLCNRLFNEVNVVGNAYKRSIERASEND